MQRKIVWVVVSGLVVLALLAASCAPAVEEAAPTAPTAPAEAIAPVVEEKPAAPTGPEMVKVSLKKLDGTVVEKMVEKPRYGGELIVQMEAPVVTWEDAYSNAGTVSRYLYPTHEYLTQGDWTRGLDGTGETTWNTAGLMNLKRYAGAVAESWEVVQPDTLIFHIRQGVHFGLNPALEASRLVGGREITADDVVSTLKRVFFEIRTAGPYIVAGVSRPVDVYATDKWTVVVKTPPEQIWATLENVSAFGVYMMAPEIAKKYGDFNDWKRVVGTGPFILTDYVAMNQVTWVRNPNYWMKDPLFPENQLPYVDTLKSLIIPDASTRMSALRTGRVDLDYTRTIGWEEAASLQKTSPQLKYSKTSGTVVHLGGRIDKPELPFKDIRVRRALMMAVNNQEIVDTYYGGTADVLGWSIPPLKEWMPAYTPLEELGLAADGFDTKKLYGYYPVEAKQLLAEAGYPKGFKTEAILELHNVDITSIIKAYWADIGVDLALDVKDAGVFNTMYRAHTYKEIALRQSSPGSTGYRVFAFRSGAGENLAMISDPVIEANYARMAALEPWTDEWFKAVKEMNAYNIHQVYYTVTPLTYSYLFWQPWLKRYQGEAVGSIGAFHPTKYLWIDQELKKARGR